MRLNQLDLVIVVRGGAVQCVAATAAGPGPVPDLRPILVIDEDAMDVGDAEGAAHWPASISLGMLRECHPRAWAAARKAAAAEDAP